MGVGGWLFYLWKACLHYTLVNDMTTDSIVPQVSKGLEDLVFTYFVLNILILAPGESYEGIGYTFVCH